MKKKTVKTVKVVHPMRKLLNKVMRVLKNVLKRVKSLLGM
jgi:hypothetical protein